MELPISFCYIIQVLRVVKISICWFDFILAKDIWYLGLSNVSYLFKIIDQVEADNKHEENEKGIYNNSDKAAACPYSKVFPKQ